MPLGQKTPSQGQIILMQRGRDMSGGEDIDRIEMRMTGVLIVMFYDVQRMYKLSLSHYHCSTTATVLHGVSHLSSEFQHVDDLGVVVSRGGIQGSLPIISSFVDIRSSINEDPRHLRMTIL